MHEVIDFIAGRVKERTPVLITGHMRPDADCVGSQLALSLAFESRGCANEVWLPDELPDNCSFLAGSERVRISARGAGRFEWAIALDTPRPERLGWIEEHIRNIPVVVNIDHHASNILWGQYSWVDKGASATAEMIFALLNKLAIPIDPAIATALYTGIITDTGRFCYSNTTPVTHHLAGELIALGVKPAAVSEWLYSRYRPQKIRLLGEVLKTLQIEEEGALAYLRLAAGMYELCGALPQDTEGFINYARDIAGVMVAVLFDDCAEGGVRVSLRSKDERIDVDKIAALYGGGGHRGAAGAVIKGERAECERRVLGDVREAILRARARGRVPDCK